MRALFQCLESNDTLDEFLECVPTVTREVARRLAGVESQNRRVRNELLTDVRTPPKVPRRPSEASPLPLPLPRSPPRQCKTTFPPRAFPSNTPRSRSPRRRGRGRGEDTKGKVSQLCRKPSNSGENSHRDPTKSSSGTSACSRRPRKVPGLIGLCMGTTTVRSALRITWCEPV